MVCAFASWQECQLPSLFCVKFVCSPCLCWISWGISASTTTVRKHEFEAKGADGADLAFCFVLFFCLDLSFMAIQWSRTPIILIAAKQKQYQQEKKNVFYFTHLFTFDEWLSVHCYGCKNFLLPRPKSAVSNLLSAILRKDTKILQQYLFFI